jgi:processive 1,2-diacylglycerol beta-glucosyltransferase
MNPADLARFATRARLRRDSGDAGNSEETDGQGEKAPEAGAPRVLFAHLSIGGGHARAAQAASRAMRRLAPNAEIADLDLAEVATPLFNAIYHDGYLGLVKSMPRLWGALYAAGWRTGRGSAVPDWLKPRCIGNLAAVLDAFAPDVVLATAAPVSALLAHLKERGACQAALAALITDYHAHPTHMQPAIDAFLVADQRVAAGLRKLGAHGSKVVVTGIPVEPEFVAPLERERARRRLGFDVRAPVVLVMGGALGSGHMVRVVRELLAIEPTPQLVVVTGRNRRLEERLHVVKSRAPGRLEIFGWTSLVPELMAAADLIVTKPGGVSTTEALVRGVPMVFVDAILGAESRNRAFFEREGVAVGASQLDRLGAMVAALLADPDRLAAMRAAAKRCARPDAAADVARVVLELAS